MGTVLAAVTWGGGQGKPPTSGVEVGYKEPMEWAPQVGKMCVPEVRPCAGHWHRNVGGTGSAGTLKKGGLGVRKFREGAERRKQTTLT